MRFERPALLAGLLVAVASVILIREEFHALGLGKNSPSSAQIAARIAARCGR